MRLLFRRQLRLPLGAVGSHGLMIGCTAGAGATGTVAAASDLGSGTVGGTGRTQFILQGSKPRQYEEGTRCKNEYGDRRIATRQNLHPKGSPRTEQFPNQSDQRQCDGEAQSHAQPIKGGRQHAVLGGIRFGTPQNDTVDHDKRYINTQRLVQIRYESVHEQFHHRDKGGNDDYIRGHPHSVRYHMTQE